MRVAEFFSFKVRIITALSLIFALFYASQVISGSVTLYQGSMRQTREYLINSAKRVQEDLSVNNGKWNMYRYNADPQLPGTYPLYILASDGFVIDRWKPVHGFLDTSDFSHLKNFSTPQTITTPTDQAWRIYSKPINIDGTTVGVITVSYFNPDGKDLSVIDKQLTDDTNIINSHLVIKNGIIDASGVDPREISFDYAFQVVDQFNKILSKSNNSNSIDRIPNFIDSSYVGDELSSTGFKQIQDAVTGEKFLIYSTPLIDTNNTVVGVVDIGRTIDIYSAILQDYIITQVIFAIIISVLSSWIIGFLLNKFSNKLKQKGHLMDDTVESVTFNKSTSTIVINGNEIPIPYATNQYYLCEALFSAPNKRWETDELLEKFGEKVEGNWRKVYDAMLIVNKKISQVVNTKLITSHEKTYQINPALEEKVA